MQENFHCMRFPVHVKSRLSTRNLALFPFVVICLLMLVWLVDVDLTKPSLQQNTDFLSTCYVSGKLIRHGQSSKLYPPGTACSYLGSAFNEAVHAELPYKPHNSISMWQYSPTNACVFSMFSLVSPPVALAIWQAFSILSLFAACKIMTRIAELRIGSLFWLSFAFFPIFQMLKMGQQGLIFGILPIVGGFALLTSGRDRLAGVVLAISILNPKYFVVAVMLVTAKCLSGRWKPLGCMLAFAALVLLASVPFTGFSALVAWLQSLRLAEGCLWSRDIYCPIFLISSLPAAILVNVPIEYRSAVKVLVYLAALLLFGGVTWLGHNLQCRDNCSRDSELLFFVLCWYAMALLEPHLLFYDLSPLLFANSLLLFYKWPRTLISDFRTIAIISTFAINLYFLVMAFGNAASLQPVLLALIQLELFRRLFLLSRILRFDTSPGACTKPMVAQPLEACRANSRNQKILFAMRLLPEIGNRVPIDRTSRIASAESSFSPK